MHADFKTALALWKPLAEKGHAKAQSAYGSMFCFGDGMEPDFHECAYWIRKARDQGEDVSKIWNDYSLWKYEKNSLVP